jgi:hypothetical protein
MAINANGSSSKPGDWAGGGNAGGGVYQEPGQRSSYDSKGNQITGYNGMPSSSNNSGVSANPNDALANLFAGGKGGPTGQVGTVAPVIGQPVSLPPPNQEPVVRKPGESMADYIARKTAEARARMSSWVRPEYNPLSSIHAQNGFRSSISPAPQGTPVTGSGLVSSAGPRTAESIQEAMARWSGNNPGYTGW